MFETFNQIMSISNSTNDEIINHLVVANISYFNGKSLSKNNKMYLIKITREIIRNF